MIGSAILTRSLCNPFYSVDGRMDVRTLLPLWLRTVGFRYAAGGKGGMQTSQAPDLWLGSSRSEDTAQQQAELRTCWNALPSRTRHDRVKVFLVGDDGSKPQEICLAGDLPPY